VEIWIVGSDTFRARSIYDRALISVAPNCILDRAACGQRRNPYSASGKSIGMLGFAEYSV
jgi:hypothetical protein